MAKLMRAQVGLVFSDEDLFYNFVKPMQNNKELAGLIVRLIAAYYVNSEVQAIADGYVDEPEEETEDPSIAEAFTRARSTLAMQGYLFDQLKLELETGKSDIEVLMNANKRMRESDIVKTEKTASGNVITEFSLEDLIARRKLGKAEKGAEEPRLLLEDSKLVNMVSSLATSVETMQNEREQVMTEISDIRKLLEQVMGTLSKVGADSTKSVQPDVTYGFSAPVTDIDNANVEDISAVTDIGIPADAAIMQEAVAYHEAVPQQEAVWQPEVQQEEAVQQAAAYSDAREDASSEMNAILSELLG